MSVLLPVLPMLAVACATGFYMWGVETHRLRGPRVVAAARSLALFDLAVVVTSVALVMAA